MSFIHDTTYREKSDRPDKNISHWNELGEGDIPSIHYNNRIQNRKETDLDPSGLVLLLLVLADDADMLTLPGDSGVDAISHLLALPPPFALLTIVLRAIHPDTDGTTTSAHIKINPMTHA